MKEADGAMISGTSNPKILNYSKIRDRASEREKQGLFALEGSRIVMDAINAGAGISEAFYTDEARTKYPETVDALISRLKDRAYEISPEVAKKLADTKSPQGIFALVERLDNSLESIKIEDGGKFAVLNGLQDPGNIGTILRCADAVGVSGVFLCGGCDLYNPKLVRSTMGSLFRLKIAVADYFDLIMKFRSCGVHTCAAVVDKSALSIREYRFPKSCAVVIGNEGNGLNAKESGVCDSRITIRMNGAIESLNAASAASIILWELTKGE